MQNQNLAKRSIGLHLVKSLVTFFLALLAVFLLLIVISHNISLQSSHLLTALSFVQPIFVLIFALPVVLGLFFLRHSKWALIILACVGANVFWNEDYRLSPNFMPKTSKNEDARVQVMAWNVQGFFFGIKDVTDAIRQSQADVLLLSEVTLKPQDLAIFEKAILPYRALLSAQGDVAILTRLPILDAKEVTLPTHQASLTHHNNIEQQTENPPRSFLHARVLIGSEILNVLSLRFIAGRAKTEGIWDSLQWGLYLWEQQDREVQFFVDYVRQLTGPFVFGGDLNAPPASRTMRLVETLGQDSYKRVHRWGHFTYMTKILPTSKEKDLPVMRLDYIFSSRDLLVEKADRIKIRLSDHFPIKVQLAFPTTIQIPLAKSSALTHQSHH